MAPSGYAPTGYPTYAGMYPYAYPVSYYQQYGYTYPPTAQSVIVDSISHLSRRASGAQTQSGDYPQSLKDYVARVFACCATPEQKAFAERAIASQVNEVFSKSRLLQSPSFALGRTKG